MKCLTAIYSATFTAEKPINKTIALKKKKKKKEIISENKNEW